jgi:hypothetical protein
MKPETLLKLMMAEPFEGFTIHCKHGKEIEVPSTEAIAYIGGETVVVIAAHDTVKIVPFSLITALVLWSDYQSSHHDD